jgi:hypothetical protein
MGLVTNKKFLLIVFLLMLLLAFTSYQSLERIGLGWIFTGGLDFIINDIILLPFKILRNILGG